jgi:hypothetical protein
MTASYQILPNLSSSSFTILSSMLRTLVTVKAFKLLSN